MKKTAKRIFSILLGLMMVMTLFSTAALADNDSTITAIDADDNVIGTYSTIDAAASAAGTGGTVQLSAGTFEFNGRQTISVAGVTLQGEGVGSTFVKTSSSFASASATNKKALLTVAANGVTVTGISFDGSPYGNTVSASTDFVVARINSGTDVTLSNVSITGSKKTLLSIGTTTTSSGVLATGLQCEAVSKDISSLSLYPDVDVVNGDFELNSGMVNGFICTSAAQNNQGETLYAGTFINSTGNHHTLRFPRYFFGIQFGYNILSSTLKHYVDCYTNLSSSTLEAYEDAFYDEYNIDTVDDMVDDAIYNYIGTANQYVATGLLGILDDVIAAIDPDPQDQIVVMRNRLNNALNPS